MSAGICVTRPSPTESLVNTSAAAAGDMSWRVTPMTMPPKMLTAVMMRPAMASPRTNLEAPSMAPKKALSSSSSRRRRVASFSSIRPALRSASIAICLPGMASSVKRAPTSAMRVAPLVMTTKLTVIRITKTMVPMTKSPLMTKLAEAGDDVAGRRVALRAVGEDEARGGDVEREAQKGGDQQDGGEGREVERLLDPQRHHQDQHGERDREGEADVDQERRQRQEQHREDEYDADGKAHVLGAAALDRLDARCNRARHRLPS